MPRVRLAKSTGVETDAVVAESGVGVALPAVAATASEPVSTQPSSGRPVRRGFVEIDGPRGRRIQILETAARFAEQLDEVAGDEHARPIDRRWAAYTAKRIRSGFMLDAQTKMIGDMILRRARRPISHATVQ